MLSATQDPFRKDPQCWMRPAHLMIKIINQIRALEINSKLPPISSNKKELALNHASGQKGRLRISIHPYWGTKSYRTWRCSIRTSTWVRYAIRAGRSMIHWPGRQLDSPKNDNCHLRRLIWIRRYPIVRSTFCLELTALPRTTSQVPSAMVCHRKWPLTATMPWIAWYPLATTSTCWCHQAPILIQTSSDIDILKWPPRHSQINSPAWSKCTERSRTQRIRRPCRTHQRPIQTKSGRASSKMWTCTPTMRPVWWLAPWPPEVPLTCPSISPPSRTSSSISRQPWRVRLRRSSTEQTSMTCTTWWRRI